MPFGSLSVDKIENSDGFTLGGSGAAMKNRIINGAMVIDQRNAGASVTPTSGQYLVDRFKYVASQASKFTAQQNQGSVTPPIGFTNYQGLTVASAVSIGSADYFLFQQMVEGYNMADLGWGTANAKTVTLSFWVRSSLTGTFGGSLANNAFDYSYPFTYTINAANTFEYKTIEIEGATSGTWLSTNGIGIQVTFGLGSGSTYSGTAGAWAASGYQTATGATSVVGTNGATFYITGVQLEVGSTATSFDTRSYGTELALCQRYYQAFFGPVLTGIGNGSTNVNDIVVPLFVPLRASPTMGSCNGAAFTSSAFNSFTSQTPTVATNSGTYTATNQLRLNFSGVSGVTDNRIGSIRIDTNLTISAEL